MKIIKYFFLIVVINLMNVEIFDGDDPEFWIIAVLVGVYVALDYD